MMNTVELKSAPDVRAIILAAFPSYRKHKAYVSAFHRLSLNSYWDGGSRDEYVFLKLATLQTKPLPTASHPYFDVTRGGLASTFSEGVEVDSRGNITLTALPEGYAVVQAGTFCGKPATAHVYVPVENMPRLLATAMPEVL